MSGVNGLKILLKYGHFVAMNATENHANKIMKDWRMKSLGEYLDGVDPSGWSWVVKVEEIVGMHTMIIQSAPQVGGRTMPPGLLGPGASGIN